MNAAKPSTELSDRRRRLGASRETMAAGLGLAVDFVKAIEDGAASEQHHALYTAWLSRIESWPDDVRARQLRTAGKGGRFDNEERQPGQ